MGTVRALFIPADQSTPIRVIDTTTTVDDDLAPLQALVGGDVRLLCGNDWCAILNEDGIMLGLPRNPRATEVALALGWARLRGDSLFGDVIILGAGGESGVTDAVLRVVENLSDWEVLA